MTNPQLPERPNLEQLKRQAKDLLRAAKSRNADALARFRALPAFAQGLDERLLIESIALHDAQSVIARELGFPSWNALAERVEELSLELGAAVDQFIDAATEPRPQRAARLLQLHPQIAGANFHTALLLGDVERIERRLAQRRELATERSGPREWEPLLYLCHTSLAFGSASRRDGILSIARRLVSLGADANGRYPWLHHGVRRPALWGAVCVTRLLALAELLLEAGAAPNDGVTLPLSAGGGDIAALELLHAHGADVNQPWASDGASALYSILNWADTPVGVHWLLAHGADANAVFTPNGETPLHVVARRWDAEVAAALVRYGADLEHRRKDGRTAYALALLSGNDAVATWLAGHGAPTDVAEVDRLVAACSRGDRAGAGAMLAARPELRSQLGPEHYDAFYRAAERGDVGAIETMLACGFDPNHADDEIGKTPLHEAARQGWPDAVRLLLAHGASVAARDREFRGQPLVWAADGFRTHSASGRDFRSVGLLLIDAGSPVDWQTGEEPADEILDIIHDWQRGNA